MRLRLSWFVCVVFIDIVIAWPGEDAIFLHPTGSEPGVSAVSEVLSLSRPLAGGDASSSYAWRHDPHIQHGNPAVNSLETALGERKAPSCVDTHPKCRKWVKEYTCNSFPNFLMANCRRSCETCDRRGDRQFLQRSMRLCADFLPENQGCQSLRKSGMCDTKWLQMSLACRATCRSGPCHDFSNIQVIALTAPLQAVCIDTSPRCFVWSLLGQCHANPKYMLEACKKSCGTCHVRREALQQRIRQRLSKCDDFVPYCLDWMEQGRCVADDTFVTSTCRRTCNTHPCETNKKPHVYLKSVDKRSRELRSLQNPMVAPSEDDVDAIQLSEGLEQVELPQSRRGIGPEELPKTHLELGEGESNDGRWKRQKIRKYLADIARQVGSQPKMTTCQDKHVHCAHWAGTGQCLANPMYMLHHCQKSCGRCGQAKAENLKEMTSWMSSCKDYHPSCSRWAMRGECPRHWLYMSLTCRASCRLGPCKGPTPQPTQKQPTSKSMTDITCKDTDEKCFLWQQVGKCNTEPAKMFTRCPRSCSTCGWSDAKKEAHMAKLSKECRDYHPWCSRWSKEGKCPHASFVKVTCQKSCGACARKTI